MRVILGTALTMLIGCATVPQPPRQCLDIINEFGDSATATEQKDMQQGPGIVVFALVDEPALTVRMLILSTNPMIDAKLETERDIAKVGQCILPPGAPAQMATVYTSKAKLEPAKPQTKERCDNNSTI